jgi:hypothetical protein
MSVQCIVYCVRCTLFPPVAEICARLACNFCQYMIHDNSLMLGK